MNPTQVLKEEHRVIECVLDCLETIARRCEEEGRLDAAFAREAIDFFRNFADRCHHGKEEDQLFPMMEERGFANDSGPVAVMRVEHDQGRAFVGAMEAAIEGASAGDSEACRDYVRNARGYLQMLRQHIEKEDHCLFPMADAAMTEADRGVLWERFQRVEREEIGVDTHARYLRLATTLAERLGISPPRPSHGVGPHVCGSAS